MPDSRNLKSVRSLEGLSHKEMRLLWLVSLGMTNREVAAHLDLTTNTVREYLSRLTGKLGVSDRTSLAVFFVLHQIKNDVLSLDASLKHYFPTLEH